MTHKTLSIILPCHNEEATIAGMIRHAFVWMHESGIEGEVIAVDNGSTDRSGVVMDELKKEFPSLTVIHHAENRGYGGSIISGCDAASGDIIAYMDSDGQFDIQDLSRLLPLLDRADCAAGLRTPRKDPWMRLLLSWGWNVLISMLLHARVRDIDCGMKAFRRSIWPLIRPREQSGNIFSVELFFRLRWNQQSWAQAPVRHFPRLHGSSACAIPFAMLDSFAQLWRLLRSSPPSPS
ncbi:MAG: glycosyltransferase family 2 protein [Candidatus Peribacteraceae bacterium]|jgi:glycosyltransferase involved in cell wall biosynthesis|nr:glycosyltransferase family 2 protein [Candidatus Peribacteraceae bacterium]